MRLLNLSLLALLTLTTSVFAQQAQKYYPTRFANVTWNNADWQLETTNLDQGHYQSRIALSNGYIGIALAALGPFFEVDEPVNGDMIGGWPLFSRRQTFATIGGFWDSQNRTNGTNFDWLLQYGGESVISGIPHWAGIVLDLGDDMYLDATTSNKTISNFVSTMDYKQARMNWQFTWTPKKGLSFDVSYQVVVHKIFLNSGMVQMKIMASADSKATLVNVLNGDCAVRTDFVAKGKLDQFIYSGVSPNGVHNVTGWVYAGMNGTGADYSPSKSDVSGRPYVGNNKSSIAQPFDVRFKAGQAAFFTKFVGVASSDAYDDANQTAYYAAKTGMGFGYDATAGHHTAEWAATFNDENIDNYTLPDGSLPDDENIIESQIVAIVNPFYLLQNTIGTNATIMALNNSRIMHLNEHSIAVGGLGSDAYAGWIFWDAEIWMQPGLVAAFPAAAQGISNYRASLYPQALENPKTAYQSSKNHSTYSDNAAAFPWISGRYGNCTAAGPCFDYEYHLNGDIALEFTNYWVVSGNTEYFQRELFPIYNSIAVFLSEILDKTADGKYELTNMTDPDEFANHVDNGGFTMPLIADTLKKANQFRSKFGILQNETWNTQADNIVLSRNENAGITLEYTGMNGSISVKQADVVLVTYPLNYHGMNYSIQNSLDDLDYYASKQSQAGPGMTYAIFAIVASEVSPSGCSAYTYQQYSERPYVRAPWFQFSEQLLDDVQINGGFHPAFPFHTGHGGANQVVLFGYLGLRLEPDGYLHVDPSLPPQIPHIRYRTFYWQGWPIKAVSNYTTTTLTRLDTPLTTANSTFAMSPIPVVIGSVINSTTPILSLKPNGTISIPNRKTADTKTVPGNLIQCPPTVYSTDPIVPGQFAISAVDGAASTKWQPASADIVAHLTVKLPSSSSSSNGYNYGAGAGGANTKIKAFYFDWAQAPPVEFYVQFHNGGAGADPGMYESSSAVTIASQNPVKVSEPFNASTVADVVPYSSNTTLYTFDKPLALGGYKYATLWVHGNQGISGNDKFNSSEPGPEVAEWGVIVDDGKPAADHLKGVIFNKEIARRSVVMPEGEVERRDVDAVRDGIVGSYGRYMRRAVEMGMDRRWR
jgi:trehalose/maltose hydrolase-like predicted phosphorylase